MRAVECVSMMRLCVICRIQHHNDWDKSTSHSLPLYDLIFFLSTFFLSSSCISQKGGGSYTHISSYSVYQIRYFVFFVLISLFPCSFINALGDNSDFKSNDYDDVDNVTFGVDTCRSGFLLITEMMMILM